MRWLRPLRWLWLTLWLAPWALPALAQDVLPVPATP